MKAFFPVMFLIFMTLKLTNYIDWSWFWVSAPLWMPICVGLVLLMIKVGLEACER